MDEVAGIQRGQYDDSSSNKQWFSKTDNLSHERGRCDISVVSKRKQKKKNAAKLHPHNSVAGAMACDVLVLVHLVANMVLLRNIFNQSIRRSGLHA